jgi:hypothetical protein
MKRRKKAPRPSRRTDRVAPEAIEEPAERGPILEIPAESRETGPALTGGDLDADWVRASSSGDESVGGSVATPDQDVVDEIGRALGVEQDTDAEFVPSEEILRRRDRFRWHLEREAEDAETAREEAEDTGVAEEGAREEERRR